MPYYAGDYYVGDPGRRRGGTAAGRPRPRRRGRGRGRTGRAAEVLRELGGAAVGALAERRAARGMAGRRYRRMNVGNIRALGRAMRRVKSFAKLAKRTIGFTKRVHMKRRKRS